VSVEAALAALLIGVFTNEEQVRFAEEAKAPVPPWVALRFSADGSTRRYQAVDAFGRPLGPERAFEVLADPAGAVLASPPPDCRQQFVAAAQGFRAGTRSGACGEGFRILAVTPAGLTLESRDGVRLELRRARPMRCWAAIPRASPKADGTQDWWFARDIRLHDQGGMARLRTDEATPQQYDIRVRNVVWPSGPNQPSLVLYVLAPGSDRAMAYSWADPGAVRLGFNIRAVQASCTVDG
jgi:hypothetical protein